MFVPTKKRIATLLKLSENINGKIDFHKIVYIMQNNGVDFDLNFTLNVFGPYSIDLNYEIETLINQNIIVKENNPNSNVETCYKLNNEKEIFAHDELLESKQIKDIVSFLKDGVDSDELELIATMYYLKNSDYNDDMIRLKLETLKENIFSKYEAAYEKYTRINIIATEKSYHSMA